MKVLGILITLILFLGCSTSNDTTSTSSTKGRFTVKAGSKTTDLLTTGTTPSAVKLKVYGAWISTSETCSDPISVFSADNADYDDFITNPPTLGSTEVVPGTYKCVIIKLSDQIKFTAAETLSEGACVKDSEYTIDVCANDEGGTDPTQVYKDLNGTSTNCANWNAADPNDDIYLYISTVGSSTDTEGNPFIAPLDSTNSEKYGIKLTSALTVVAGQETVSYFNLDATNKVAEETNPWDYNSTTKQCGLDQPTFAFTE